MTPRSHLLFSLLIMCRRIFGAKHEGRKTTLLFFQTHTQTLLYANRVSSFGLDTQEGGAYNFGRTHMKE